MNESPQHNQQTEPKQCESEVKEIWYSPKTGLITATKKVATYL